jgi:hypothetical protein
MWNEFLHSFSATTATRQTNTWRPADRNFREQHREQAVPIGSNYRSRSGRQSHFEFPASFSLCSIKGK